MKKTHIFCCLFVFTLYIYMYKYITHAKAHGTMKITTNATTTMCPSPPRAATQTPSWKYRARSDGATCLLACSLDCAARYSRASRSPARSRAMWVGVQCVCIYVTRAAELFFATGCVYIYLYRRLTFRRIGGVRVSEGRF